MRFRYQSDVLAIVLLLVTAACHTKDTTPANIPVTPRDTTITVTNAFTLLQLDSQGVASYLDSAFITDTSRLLISNFYNSRNYQYAWFDEEGLTEHAAMLWNRYKDYKTYGVNAPSIDSAFNIEMDRWIIDTVLNINAPHAQEAELRLTRLFFDYAFAKFIGNLNPSEMQWYIPRRKVDVAGLLDSLIEGSKSHIHEWEPLHPQYRLLKNKLLAYALIAERGGWDSLKLGIRKKLMEGEEDTLVTQVKRRLSLSGQYREDDSSNVFTPELKDSLKIVQQAFGLTGDGELGPATLTALNVSVEQRMRKILVNMERLRWLPAQPDSTWILANIPSFRLQVFDDDTTLQQMNIVVGTAGTRTVIFSDSLKYIVFSPYWNVPPSIVRNEILPAMKKNTNYLKRSRMEQVGTNGGLPVIRQLPGPGNALGQVKFLFPNEYNIYLHDTPAKTYFSQNKRAFSHGCVRVGKPFELTKCLLRGDSSWNNGKILKAMTSRKEQWVTLQHPVPVFITYFTSWVDNNGRLQFWDDIYQHDERMINHLFVR